MKTALNIMAALGLVMFLIVAGLSLGGAILLLFGS